MNPSKQAPQVGVFGRIPRNGAGKTRLAAGVGPDRAAALAAAFLADTLDAAFALAPGGAWWWVAPEDGRADDALLREAHEAVTVPRGIQVRVQRGTHLGERMDHALGTMLGRGPALVLGADVPDLPPSILEDALARLSAATGIVLGPADDGGFYLVGCAAPPGEVLRRRADWGGADVFARTVADAARVGLEVHVLPRWADVDDVAALAALGARLERARAEGTAARPGWPTRTAALVLSR